MNKRLKTSHVFIDTEVFISANFKFSSGRLKKVKDLLVANKITIHLTDITIKEVESNIEKAVSNLNSLIKDFQNKAKIIQNIEPYDILFSYDSSKVLESIKADFSKFLKSWQAKDSYTYIAPCINVISINAVSIESIFEKYFTQKAPFKDGKKKNEFPDAFVIAALEHRFSNQDEIADCSVM
jgi:predicted nucleic acid-binding protein